MYTPVKKIFLGASAWGYRWVIRPIFFLFDPTKVHGLVVRFGELLGDIPPFRSLLSAIWRIKSPALSQDVDGLSFENPVGLAAGFDYNAWLPKILPSVGLGFGTVDTLTNEPYGGNPGKMLGRLVRSKSILVNKGFKNKGIRKVLQKMEDCKFKIPVGLSIGPTNKNWHHQSEAVADIISAFKAAEESSVPFAYYELNISCPNLMNAVSFYPPENLRELLEALREFGPSRPIFVKMPINETDEDALQMLKVISEFPVTGVIFGNLQKDRNHPELDAYEVSTHGAGYFSGKPTEKRSNELIRLAYKNYGDKLVIIGCGGIMSAEDAYKKIKSGASLVQLITGLIFMGPQLPGQINLGLIDLLKKDGYKNISEAVGAGA